MINYLPPLINFTLIDLDIKAHTTRARNRENKKRYKQSEVAKIRSELAEYVEIIDKRDFAKISILSTGERARIPERLLSPVETKGLLDNLKAVRQKMEELRRAFR